MTFHRLPPLLLCIAAVAAFVVAPYRARAQGAVQVYILAGQSNMVGHGKVEDGLDGVEGAIGSLRYMVDNEPGTFGHGGTQPLVDAAGDWLVRSDVKIYATVSDTTTKKGDLTTGYGREGSPWIGPEYGFGQVIGDAKTDDVLLIKMAWGGKSLAVDFRPPSAVASRGGAVGVYYTNMINGVNGVLANLDTEFPEFAGRDYHIAGFGWHQGWNDRIDTGYSAEYEENLVDLINDVRAEFSRPDLPFTIGTTGMAPPATYTAVELAQLAVADANQYSQFEGNVATVDTRPYWRDSTISPSSFGYHWNHNGITHYEVGEGMAQAMLTLTGDTVYTRPFVTVDLQTGEIRIANTGSDPNDMDLEAYSITSAAGALDPASWTSIDGNYDADGDGSVDSGDWTVTTSTNGQLSEQAEPGGADGLIAIGAEVSLGVGAWIQNPTRDLMATYTDTEGNVISLSVLYTGDPLQLADLDFDGAIDANDWAIFIEGHQMNMSGLTGPQAYQAGDLDGDLDNDISDFDLFRKAFEAANPEALAFETMLDNYFASIPEPGTILLLGFGAAGLCLRRRRRSIALLAVLGLCLLAGPASAELIVNVNMYAASGSWAGIPQDANVLDGPGGGLGEAWNQFNTNAGTGLLDSTGTATSVEFTNNVSSGWGWGSPSLDLIQCGMAHFGKGADTTHTISGLTPGVLYDVWVASYAHNTTLGERALGEWSTPNVTTTAGAQMVDSRTAGLNGDTWEYGVNYVSFENVKADDFGKIVLIGDAADEGDYGETYATRLPLNGWRIEEVVAPVTLTLQVNTVTGAMALTNPGDGPLDINYYQITSDANSLDAAGWTSLQDQNDVAGGFPAGDGTGNGWEEAGHAGPHALAEGYLQGDSTFTPGLSLSLGAGYDRGVDAQDLVFKYRTDIGQILEGLIEYIETSPGDTNGDNVTDAADYITVKKNLGQGSGAALADGDFDGDSDVDWDDLQTLASGMAVGASGGTIPEPTSALLLLLAGGGWLLRRRTRG